MRVAKEDSQEFSSPAVATMLLSVLHVVVKRDVE